MVFYFKHFPIVDYRDENDTSIISVDITKRYKFIENVLRNKYIFYTYEVKEGERPDIIADKYYGDSSLDYLILLMNTMIDPFFEWPLSYTEFQDYIVKKYGSIPTAQQTIVKYYKILQEQVTTFDGFQVPEKIIEVDSEAFGDLSASVRRSVSAYNYEKDQNEQRRKIKLIDKSYMPQILQELEKILAN